MRRIKIEGNGRKDVEHEWVICSRWMESEVSVWKVGKSAEWETKSRQHVKE